MSDDQDTRRRHNARRADARRLQKRYPGLRYTDAYTASTPDAQSWRKFAESVGYATVASCASYVGEAASLLEAAAQDCGEPVDRDRRVEGFYFAHWLALCLTEVATFVDMVSACGPFVPDDPFQPSPASPTFPGSLRTHTGLHDVTVMLTHASSCLSSVEQQEGTPGAPAAIVVVARHVHALRAWSAPPPAAVAAL